MKPSIFTNIFRDFPLEEVVPEVARIGYPAVELMGRAPHLPPDTAPARVREIKRLLDDHGLVVSCIAGYAGRYSQIDDAAARAQIEDLKRFLEMATVLGCGLLRHQPGGPSYDQASEEQWRRSVEWLQKAADLAAGADAGLVETADSALDYVERVGRDNLGAIFDPGNMHLAGTPFGAAEVYKLWGHIFHVHVKDALRVADQTYPSSRQWRGGLIAFKLLGEGEVDHRPALAALDRLGYAGYLSCECELRWPSWQAVRLCAEHEHRALTSMLDEIAG
jgi:sugar phosphate isomerase/epimerase